jgi:RHS repeat-associated protein
MLKRLVAAALVTLLPAAASAQVVEYYHLDVIGNVRAVTGQASPTQVLEWHDYLPFGEEWNPQPGTQPKRFTGKERDAETGLDYFGARYYGSKIGRFTTVDPVYTWKENLEDPQRWNRYAYGRDNPLRFIDPDGRKIKVEGYVSEDHATVIALINTLATETEFGRRNVTAAIEDPDRTLTITLGARTRYNADTDTILFNPNARVPLETEDGWQFGAPIVALAHELAHATGPTMGQICDEQRAVMIENSVRGEFGFPYRVSYPVPDSNWTPSTPAPPWAIEWSQTATAR